MFGLYNFFEANAINQPDKTAIVYAGEHLSYSQLQKRVNSLADSLSMLGCKSGDKVAFMFRNGEEFVEIFYAVQKLGAVCVPLCYMFEAEELEYNLRLISCDWLLYDGRYIPLINEVKPKLDTVKAYIHTGSEAAQGEYLLDTLLRDGCDDWVCGCSRTADDDAMYLFTSGSTGRAKCVVHSFQNLSMFVTLPMTSGATFFPDDVMLYYAPLFHLAGVTYMMYLMSVGGTLVLVDRFDTGEILRLFAEEKVTQTFLIPPVLATRLSEHPDFGKYDLSSMRYVIMSGGSNTKEFGELVYGMFPNAKISNTYGMSERAANTILCLTREEFEENPGLINSVGKVTQFGQIKLMDDSGNETDFGEAYAKCPGMFKGYLNMPDAFDNGWFPTGDILRRDSDGYFYFMDRKKDMIKTGGENVFSIEVENVLRQHPAVQNCAVVGLPDEMFQEAVSAAVVKKPGASLTEKELIDFCRQHMPSYKKPRNVFFVDSLPTSASGKIKKSELREQLRKLL